MTPPDYDDLCKRLREDAARWSDEMVMSSLEREAADAIEALRSDNEAMKGWQEVAEANAVVVKIAQEQIAALREQVAEQKAAAFYWQETAKHRGRSLNQAEADNAALRQALQHIAEPLAWEQDHLEPGYKINGPMMMSMLAQPSYYHEIARVALLAGKEKP